VSDQDKDTEDRKLSEAEGQYRALFDQSPYGILIIDTDGNFIEFNEAAHQQLGYTREEFSRLRISDVDPFHNSEEIEASLREVLRKGKADFEVKHRTKSGTIRDVRVLARVLDFSGRDVFSVIWQDITEGKCSDETLKKYRKHLEHLVAERTVKLTLVNEQLQQDITERKKIEETLRDREERYRLLFHKTPIGIFNYDTQLILTEWNDRFMDILQSSREKLANLDMKILKDQSVIPALRTAIEGYEGHYEGYYEGTTGPAKIWVTMRTAPIFDQDGKVKNAVGIVEDITERKKAEEALRDVNNRLNAILQTSPAAIYVMTVEGIITMWNKAAERMFGWTEEEAVGRVLPIVAEDKLEEFHISCDKILRGEPFVGVEVRRQKKDGSPIDVSISAAPLYDSTGAATGLMSVATDITLRKQMEEELLKSQKLESLGILAGGIAHDFNNILTAIVGDISLIRLKMKPDDPLSKLLEGAETASYHAKALTQQLLTFAKGGTTIKKTLFVEELIRDSVTFALRGSHVKCDFSFAEGLWPVEIDEGQVNQVFNNLVINACQAMPEGGKLRIGSENVDIGSKESLPVREGKYVKIIIEDQGTGISEKHLQKIFDPYFTTKQEGCGLGLSIVHSIIRNHDGYVTVKSELGGGTTFTMYLPVSAKQIAEKKPDEEECIVAEGRVLLMDDEKRIRDVASRILKEFGYEVEVAADGAEAIRLYKSAMESPHPFDVVILDLTVAGGMGGKEAIRKLREIDPEVTAIVSSGYSNDAVMTNFEEHGFKAVIAKPFKSGDLNRIVHKVITES